MSARDGGVEAPALSKLFTSLRGLFLPTLPVLDGRTIRFPGDFDCRKPMSFVVDGTRITIAVGARIGRGTRIHLLGGSVEIAAGAVLGESVDIRPARAITIAQGVSIEDFSQLQSDAADLALGERVRVGRMTRLWAHSAPITLGDETTIGPSCTFIGTGRGISIAPRCDFTHGVTLDSAGGVIDMATRSGVGPNSVLYGHGGLRIGSGVAIAGLTMLVPGNHRFAQLDVPIRAQGTEPLPISIGDDVWIGAGVTVLGGASISDGCVIGAGSVVRGQLPPRVVAAGVPARIIRSRGTANHS